jgi:hypothetical protein
MKLERMDKVFLGVVVGLTIGVSLLNWQIARSIRKGIAEVNSSSTTSVVSSATTETNQ